MAARTWSFTSWESVYPAPTESERSVLTTSVALVLPLLARQVMRHNPTLSSIADPKPEAGDDLGLFSLAQRTHKVITFWHLTKNRPKRGKIVKRSIRFGQLSLRLARTNPFARAKLRQETPLEGFQHGHVACVLQN